MKSRRKSATIIGGDEGPVSIFVAGFQGKVLLGV